MKTIFYVYNPCWRLWPKRAEGVCRAARTRGWNVEFVVTPEDEKVVQEYFDFFRPAGCIVESSPTPQIDGICVRRGIPIVVCDGGGGGRRSTVVQASDASALRAVEELKRLGTDGVACAGMPMSGGDWNDTRMKTFRDGMSAIGRDAACFGWQSEFTVKTFDAWMRALREWLRTLPRPCALFAVNDYVGAKVVETCRSLGLRVPDDIAVIGVDNDAILCENVAPTLSSIEPDFEGSGAMAVDLVEESVRNPAAPARCVSFGVRQVVHRRSTMRIAGRCARVAEASEFIRLHCAEPIGADDVAKRLGCSRRHADQLFVRSSGMTVREAILGARLERAAEALSRPNCRVSLVAEACGFGSDVSFRRMFAARYGASPKAWSEMRLKSGTGAGGGKNLV